MTEAEFINWLTQQASTLDAIIAQAGRQFQYEALQVRSSDQFGFDLSECQIESWNLRDGKDLCYDRPNTPLVYSLWYHARRVNTFLTHFAPFFLASEGVPSLEVFDLGAGTGAVQWAIGLIYQKMKEEGMAVPKIKIINVDTSPFMLYYGRDYLWKHFVKVYKHCEDFSHDIEYEINSWSNSQKLRIINPWIAASYLFDVSDTSANGDYKQAVLRNFQEIVANYKPSMFLLLTSLAKEGLVNEVAREFSGVDFIAQKIKHKKLFLKGPLPVVNAFRKELFTQYSNFLSSYKEVSIKNPASWDDVSFVGTVIAKRQIEIYASSSSNDGVNLHSQTVKVRKDVQLNDDQKKAARNINQPTVVIGPAGCGKSIVITQRLYNIVEEFEYTPNLKILLTTFNKELLAQLREWVMDLVNRKMILKTENTVAGFKVFFIGNNTSYENIRILHFDMLPKHLGNIPYWGLVADHTHRRILTDIINGVKHRNQINDSQYDSIMNCEFLLEEYHRVIYGLQVPIKDSKEQYFAVYRRGRGTSLDRNRRELVWQCLHDYDKYIYTHEIPSFIIRRQLFLNKLQKRQVNYKYDYVIVDEFQDCTKADFEIFFNLLHSPNSLIISGDLAQAVHLGKSASIDALREAIRGDREMKDISWNYLDGSYRLPFRICEAIKGISEYIHLSFKKNHAARILMPYKGAPPGARPIVIVGKDELEVAKKILEVLRQYERFDLKEKCILEKDVNLERILHIETDTVLRLKGLEKQCVIWSTRAPIDFQKEKFEFVYTILTRTSSILIIALFNGDNLSSKTQEIFKDAIGLLNRERLIFWDKQTKDEFGQFCQEIQDSGEGDE